MTCEPGRASYTIRPANPADLPALQALAALRPAVAFLEVRANNHAAQVLYTDLGYRVSGRRRAYYPNPDGSREDALVLCWQAAPTE